MDNEVKEGRLLAVHIVARSAPRVQAANPDEVLRSRTGLEEFDLVLTYEAAEDGPAVAGELVERARV